MRLERESIKGGDLAKDKGKIVLQDIEVSYNGYQNIINGLSFYANRREIMAIIGRNAAGKTTLI